MALSKESYSPTYLNGLGGQTHEQTELVYPSKGATYADQINDLMFMRKYVSAIVQLRAEQLNDGLKIGVHAGNYTKADGTRIAFNEVASFTLDDNTTNYVYIDVASNALTKNTSAFPASESTYVPIAEYETAAGAIVTSDEDADRRQYVLFRLPPASIAAGSIDGVSFTLDADNAGAGVDCYFGVNRGTAGHASLKWDETSDKWVAYAEHGVTKATVDVGELQIGGTSAVTSSGAAKVQSSVAADGLSHSAGQLSVNVDSSTIEISSDSLRVKDGGVTAAKLSSTVQDALVLVSIPNGSGSSPLDVTIQLQDFAGNSLAEVCYLRLLIAEDADGAANASDEVLTVPSVGSIVRSLTAGKDIVVKTNSSGQVTVRITTSTPGTSYLLAMPAFRSKFLHCAGYGTIIIS